MAIAQTPGDIRIADLARPQLSAAQRAAIAAAEAQPAAFAPEALLAAARQSTGLHNFGEAAFTARLAKWCAAADADAGLNALGRAVLHQHISGVLRNRLRLLDLLRRHPEIARVELQPPVIIAGLPRSGTTHLLNLLAADARFRSLPFWESLEPVPAPHEGAGRDGLDPRFLRCQAAYQMQREQMPLLRAMHDMPPEHIHEEIELLELDLASYRLEWLARAPAWRDFYLQLDMPRHLRFLKRALQALSWLRGPRRWVLKCPQHLEWLPALAQAFPDATVVFTHRCPVAVVQSIITMLAYGDRTRRRHVDLPGLAEYWIARVEQMLRACVAGRAALPAARSLDLRFHEWPPKALQTAAHVYSTAGMSFAPAKAALQAQLRAAPRNKFGRVRYALQADFGVSPAALHRRFGFYTRRFEIQPEVPA